MKSSNLRSQRAIIHPAIFLIAGLVILVLILVSYLIFVGPSPELYEVFVIALIIVIGLTFVFMRWLRRFLKGMSPLDPHRLISSVGEVNEEIHPNELGVVLVKSELWSATSDEVIKRNERVEVVGIEGNVLRVRRVQEQQTTDPLG
jgi:membrane protein implicated in regulation of membrane protease activity